MLVSPGRIGVLVSLASLALVCPGNGALAAPALPVIGFATSDKQVRVNGRLEHGNVTLFEGDAIYSEDSVCRIHIKNGTSLSLANKSRVRLSAETVDLDEGSARIFGYPLHSYTTRARGLLVRADRAASGTVSVSGRTIEVIALTGNLHVLNSQGTMIANVAPGQSVRLDPAVGSTQAYSLTGCVVNSGGDSFLTDATAGITVELQGPKLPTGKVLAVRGTAVAGAHPPAQATQLIQVESYRQVPGSCRQMSRPATAAAAGTIAVTSGALGASLAAGVGAAAVSAGAVVAGVAASSSHDGVGITNTNPPLGSPNCVSPCYLH
jgi:hypothetical protein